MEFKTRNKIWNRKKNLENKINEGENYDNERKRYIG